MFKERVFLLLSGLWLHGGAQEFEAFYTFANVSSSSGTVAPAPQPQVAGLTCGSFSAFGVAANPNASGRFSFTGWPVGASDGADNYATYTAALSPFSYYEVMLEPSPGFTLQLQSMRFAVRRSGSGVRNYCVRSSVDNYNNNLSAGTGTSVNLSVIPDEVFFWKYDNASTSADQRGSEVTFGATHNALGGPVHLRIYAWNSEAGSGTFSIDDVVIRGQILDSALAASRRQEPAAVECNVFVKDGCLVCGCRYSEICLYNLEGRLCKQWDVERGCLSLGGLPAGLYVAVMSTKGRSWRKKVPVVAH